MFVMGQRDLLLLLLLSTHLTLFPISQMGDFPSILDILQPLEFFFVVVVVVSLHLEDAGAVDATPTCDISSPPSEGP